MILVHSDHLMLKFTIIGPKRCNTTTEEVPDWTKADYESMEKEIGEMDWELAFSDKSGSEQWELFKDKLNLVIDSNVPKKVRRKGNKPLWMKRNTLRLIRKKRRLWKHYSSSKVCSKDYAQFEAYKKVLEDVRKAVKKAKKEFEKKLAKNAKKNSKLFWSYMKQKTSNRVTVGPLVRDRVVITDDKEMFDVLNQKYCSVFTREDLTRLPDVEQNFPYSEDHELQDVSFTKEKVRAKLAKLKPSSGQALHQVLTRFGQEYCRDCLQLCAYLWPSSSPHAWLKGVSPLTGS